MKKALAPLVLILTIGPFTQTGAAQDVRNGRGPSLGPALGPVQLPETGALFGAYVKPDDHNGLDRRTAVTNFEALIGRQLAIERVYYRWDQGWPTSDDDWSRDAGRTLYISWNAGTLDTCTPWADIAAGLHDAEIDARAAGIIAFGAPMIFSFHHEPTTHNPGVECGTAADYVAAWRHVHDRFVADGVTNVNYAWTMTALTFERGTADAFYPGDDVTDIVASDGFNWYGCPFHGGPWRPINRIFDDFYAWGLAHGKPMIVAEYASGEDPAVPGRKGQWFTDGADTFKEWPQIKAVSYYNIGNAGCDRYVDTSQSSLDAFRTMGFEPYFNPPVATAPVTVADFSFSPTTQSIAQGTGVAWSFTGPSDHTATSARGLGLFDSGSVSPGGDFTYYFIAAGSYQYNCTIHPSMKATVKVPILAQPPSGGITTEFTITWSVELAPTSWAFDVQIKRPGATKWSNWLILQTGNFATFVPDGGTGTYSFRARMHNTTNGLSSNYSASVSILVN